jgi:hypothetical protein
VGGSPAKPGGSTAPLRRIALLPLNVVVTLPSEVESGVDTVSRELRLFLEAHGFAVDPLELAEAREAWLRSALALKAEVGPDGMSFEGAARTLARQLRETRRFDALIVPWIAMRPARMQGGTASWDGIKRKVHVVASDGKRRSSWALGRLRAVVTAPSLQVVAFSPDGEKLDEGVGGLDLVHDADLDVTAATIHFEMTPRPAIFQDPETVRQGIAIALGPVLPALQRDAE